ncbi:MAG: AI-2E family transporter [Candidatus Paceibacterota bacterium]
MQTKIIERYFFFILLFATFIFSFFIFRPFWIVLVLGASFSIVLYPIYEWLNKKHLPSWLSAFLVVFFFTIIICGPLFGMGVIVFNQSQDLYNTIIKGGNVTPFLNSINESINKVLPQGITFDIGQKISESIYFLSNNIAKIFSTTLSTMVSFFLMLLSIFYFLKDGAQWKKSLIRLSPLSDANDQKIISRLSLTINGVITGSILIALIQGILMGIGLAFFGVPSPALWGVVAAIVSLIPTIGTAFVSVPSVIFLYTTGHTLESIGLLIWSALLVGMIDNFLSPIIVGKKINIPPFLILFSVLGGIVLLGPVGVLIGPLSVSLLYTLVSIYRNEFKQENNS